ncbi:histidine kinase [Rhodoglobus sp. NPDC076762]
MASPTSPRAPRVPASEWGGLAWRLAVVVILGLMSFLAAYGLALDVADAGGRGAEWMAPRMVIDVVLGTAAIQLYPFRRQAPIVVVGVIVVLSAMSVLAFGAAAFAIVSVATRRNWREIVLIAALFLGATTASELTWPLGEPLPAWQLLIVSTLMLTVLIVTGMYIGGRRELWAATIEKAASAERELQAKLAEARANERSSIAREMHDVLAHRLSLVAVHAGALEYRTDLSAQQISESAGVLRSNAHLALTELRDVLGVLQQGVRLPDAETVRPQPTLATIDELLAESVAAGSSINFQIDSITKRDLVLLPDSLTRDLYRLLQESLTNARKHATAQPVDVRISGSPGAGIALWVSNPLASGLSVAASSPPSGLGLAGLEERARLAGGELVATRDLATFTVEVWLPWEK